jgi:peptide/nickel transport system substrate-binding protein
MAKGTRLGLSLTVLGAASALALTACGSSGGGGGSNGLTKNTEGGFGSIPAATGTPTKGGTVSYALSPGATPNYIFPITDGNHASVYNSLSFQDLMWRPMYWSLTGASPNVDFSRSLAGPPTFADNNKTITMKMDKGFKWSDGQPVTSQDVLFTINLAKAAVKEGPSTLANYTPGEYPDNIVSVDTPDPNTVVLHLNKTFNSSWLMANELTGFSMEPLPSHAWDIAAEGGPHLDWKQPANAKKIFDFLVKQSSTISTYATNPLWQVVDGPYKLKSFNASTGGNTLVANPAYTGPNKPNITTVNQIAYTSTQAEWNDVLSGKLDVGYVDPANVPQLSKVAKQGYAYYGLPSTGFTYMFFNFENTTNNFDKIIGQLYARQALAHLQNQDAVIKGVYRNAAVPQYSPLGLLPKSDYSKQAIQKNPYPYSIAAAKKLFSDHGWTVQGGVLTCTKPGSGANQCGDGVPQGAKFTFTLWYANDSQALAQQIEAFSSAAKQVGINIHLKSFTFNQLLQTADDNNSPSTKNQWGIADFGGFTNVIYPTSDTIFNTTGSYNFGHYSDPKADQLIEASVFGKDPNAVAAEANYLAKNLPGIFEPARDRIWVWKKTLQGPAKSFNTLSQNYLTPEYWWFNNNK